MHPSIMNNRSAKFLEEAPGAGYTKQSSTPKVSHKSRMSIFHSK